MDFKSGSVVEDEMLFNKSYVFFILKTVFGSDFSQNNIFFNSLGQKSKF